MTTMHAISLVKCQNCGTVTVNPPQKDLYLEMYLVSTAAS